MYGADVVIIGSGATGSLLAARLGESGLKVVVLEGGPRRSLNQLYSSTIWSRRLKWHGPPAQMAGNNPVTFPFEAGWGRGGAALHHYACWFRLHPTDFKPSLHNEALDWPIDYEDLRPWYDRLQKDVGIAGDAVAEIWRPPGDPYPMPPLPVFQQGKILAGGFSKEGLHVAPLPMAINSTPYNGRPACIQDGWCDAGCPTGALANPITIFGEAMTRAGVETRYQCFVSRIMTNSSGSRVENVEFYDERGERKAIAARVVILAAFAVQNPRILLNSVNENHPQGLANSSGLVGRYFAAHGAVNCYGLFGEETEVAFGRTGGQLMCQDDYESDHACGYTWRIGAALKLGDLGGIANAKTDLFGESLSQFMADAPHHLATASVLIGSSPMAENRIELTSQRDEHGIPVARLTHSLPAQTRACSEKAVAQGKRIFAAAGAREVWAASLRTEHMMGGTIMGKDGAKSVTDSFGRTHDVENLFIAGPGLFPAVGAVNPTFTASALAARTAAHIVDNWSALSPT